MKLAVTSVLLFFVSARVAFAFEFEPGLNMNQPKISPSSGYRELPEEDSSNPYDHHPVLTIELKDGRRMNLGINWFLADDLLDLQVGDLARVDMNILGASESIKQSLRTGGVEDGEAYKVLEIHR